MRGAIARVVRRARKRRLSGMERILVDEFDALVGTPPTPAAAAAPACPGCDTTSFGVSSRILQRLSHAFLQRAVNEFRKGGLLDGLQALGALAPLGLGMAPYFTAFVAQHKDEAFLQSAAERFPGAEPRVAFTGLLEGERPSEAYASADAFVFPSLTDTFGNAVLEAHASGLPAIVSNQGGPPEIVATHGSGLVVEGGSSVSWVDAMRQLRRSPETYDRLRHGALERARASRWETALDML